MKILVLATDIFSKGGIQEYTKNLIKALKGLHGIKNVYVASLLAGRHEELEEIHADLIGGPLNLFTKLKFTIQSLYSVKKWGINLIVCNHVSLTPIANLAKRIFGTRCLVITYGIDVWGRLRKRDKAGLREADAVVSISGFTSQALVESHRIDSNKIFLIPPCTDTERFFPEKPDEKLAKKHGLLNKRVLLTVGRLAPGRDKGHDRFIRALKRVKEEVPEVAYLVVGSGSDKIRLEGIAKGLDLQDHVLFTGFISDALLPKYYNLCDVFVMAGRLRNEEGGYAGEGFGIVYLEANACEKPVIAGKYGGSAEAVVDSETGILVDPDKDSVDEIANSIIKLLLDRKLVKKMGIRGRERVLKEFSYEAFKNNVKRLFNKLAGLRE